jgi:hypothetical protein
MTISEILSQVGDVRRLWSYEEKPNPGEYELGEGYVLKVSEHEIKKGESRTLYLISKGCVPVTMSYDWDTFQKHLNKPAQLFNNQKDQSMAKLSIHDQELRDKVRLKCANDWDYELTEDQISMCIIEMEEQKLSLFHNQIWPNKRKYQKPRDDRGNREWTSRITWDKSIDGYRSIAHQTGLFAGADNAEFDVDESGSLIARVTVYRLDPTGKRNAFVGEARFSEFVQLVDEWKDGRKTGKRIPNYQWSDSPHNQLSVAAERQALRKAFQDFKNDTQQVVVDSSIPDAEPPEPEDKPSRGQAITDPKADPAHQPAAPAAEKPAEPEPEESKGTYVGIPEKGFKEFGMYNKEERIVILFQKSGQFTLALDSGQRVTVSGEGYETDRRDRTDNNPGGRDWGDGEAYYNGAHVEKIAKPKNDETSLWLALDDGFKVFLNKWGKEEKRKERKKKESTGAAKPESETDSKPEPDSAEPADVDIEAMDSTEQVRKACIPLLAQWCRDIKKKKVSYKEAYEELTGGVKIEKGSPMSMEDYQTLYTLLEEALGVAA